jgi:hypothetical protein
MRVGWRIFCHGFAVSIAIHVQVFDEHEFCITSGKSVQDGFLQKRKFFRPGVIRRLCGLIYHLCPSRHLADFGLIVQIGSHQLHPGRHFVHRPRSIDHPHGFAAPHEFFCDRAPDRACA